MSRLDFECGCCYPVEVVVKTVDLWDEWRPRMMNVMSDVECLYDEKNHKYYVWYQIEINTQHVCIYSYLCDYDNILGFVYLFGKYLKTYLITHSPIAICAILLGFHFAVWDSNE
jgi:hypothetical protein